LSDHRRDNGWPRREQPDRREDREAAMATEEYLFGSGLPVSHRAGRRGGRDGWDNPTPGGLRPVSGGVVSHRAGPYAAAATKHASAGRRDDRDDPTSGSGVRPVSGGAVRPVSGGGAPNSHRAGRRDEPTSGAGLGDEPTSGAGLAPVSPGARSRFEGPLRQAWSDYEDPPGGPAGWEGPPTYAGTQNFAPQNAEPAQSFESDFGPGQGIEPYQAFEYKAFEYQVFEYTGFEYQGLEPYPGLEPDYAAQRYDEPPFDDTQNLQAQRYEQDGPEVYPFDWPEFGGDSMPTEELTTGRSVPISHRKREPVRRAAVRVLAAVLVAGGGISLAMNLTNHTSTTQAAPLRTGDDASRSSLRPTSAEESATPAPTVDPTTPAGPATDQSTTSSQSGTVRNAPALVLPVPTTVPTTTPPPTTVPTKVPPTTVPPTSVPPTTVPPTTAPATTTAPTSQLPVSAAPTVTSVPATTAPASSPTAL